MKLVPNMIYSRETEFSFWVRLVPVRSSPPSCWQWHTLRYPGATGWPQGPQARTPFTAHFVHFLHIVATTLDKGKGFYSFSFRVPIVTEKLEIRVMTEIQAEPILCWLHSPNTDDTGESSSSLLVLRHPSTHSPDLLAVRCFRTMY